jgi:hypothetical protein
LETEKRHHLTSEAASANQPVMRGLLLSHRASLVMVAPSAAMTVIPSMRAGLKVFFVG